MSVQASDLKLFKSQFTPSDEVSVVGGVITATQITGSTIGETFAAPLTIAAMVGGATRIHYEKIFYQNTNSSSPLNSASIFCPNILGSVATPGPLTVVSNNAIDNNTFQIFAVGIDNLGNPITETLPLQGTNPVQGVQTFAFVARTFYQLASNSSLVAATGNISHSVSGQTIGMIPGGFYSSTGELMIGLAASKNDGSMSANTVTAPSGVVFSSPNTYNAALGVPGTNLNALDGIGIWCQLTIKPGLNPSSDVQMIFQLVGTPG